MSELRPYYKITIEYCQPYMSKDDYVRENTSQIYMQKVTAIDIANISKLVNAIETLNAEREANEKTQ